MTEKSAYRSYEAHYERVGNAPASSISEYGIGKFAREYRGWLPEDRDAEILDCGCGTGHQLYVLAKLGYKRLTGIDMLDVQAVRAREELGGMAEVHTADAFEWLAARGERYDVITCFDVLEHIPSDKALEFLDLIKGGLKRGGTAVFRVPNMSTVLASFAMHIDITHVAGYTEFGLMQLMDLAGFTGHRVENSGAFNDFVFWRPWRPWRGFRRLANWLFHRVLYAMAGAGTKPSVFETNILISTRKPAGG